MGVCMVVKMTGEWRLLHRGWCELGMLGQQCPLVGMVAPDPAGHTGRPLTAKDGEGLWIWRAAAVRSATGARGNSRKRDRGQG